MPPNASIGVSVDWITAVQTLLSNGLVAPSAVSSLIAALASSPNTPRQAPLAPAALTDPEVAAALSYQELAQQVCYPS